MSEPGQISILLVGDQRARLAVHGAALSDLGGGLVTASAAPEALRRIEAGDIGVVVLDASVPRSEAFTTAALLRHAPKGAGLPLILLTDSHVTNTERLVGHRLGDVRFVDCPVEQQVLRDEVASALEGARRRRELERHGGEAARGHADLLLANGKLQAELRQAIRTREEEATERERVEDTLRQTEARLSVILDSTSVAIGQIDLDNRFVYVNRGFAELFGIVGADVRGRSLHELLRPEIAEAFEANLRRVIQDDRPLGFEEISETADRLHAYNAVNSPIRDASGNPCGVVSVFTDVTQRRRLEAALRDADRRKDEFLAVLAHELRNPLAPILSAADVLTRRHVEDPDLRWCSEVIGRQTEHLARLVDDLLDVARITQGKIALRAERMEIGAALARAIEANRPLIDARRQRLIVEIPSPSPMVHGDILRLSQVISNLLNNAAKYTPDGGEIRVRVEQVPSDQSSAGDVLVHLSDSGMGIPTEMLPTIFDLFTQVESRAREQGGLGIGLALVARLVEMHGGSVVATSAGENLGSKFTVRLPALGEKHQAGAPRPVVASLERLAMSGLCILVVDDNKDAAQSLAIFLRLAGHRVDTAHDGLEAVELAERLRPDVVLMDIGMPRLDGHGAASRIRAQPWGRRILLVALTGWGQDDDRALTKAAGFDAHLVKPVNTDELLTLIAEGAVRDPQATDPRTSIS